MKADQVVSICALSMLLLASACSHNNSTFAPPAPPATHVPGIVQLGSRNGFVLGHEDGGRDATSGFAFGPRHTSAYHNTPGYDPVLGTLGAYRKAFREAYVRGYGAGYNRR